MALRPPRILRRPWSLRTRLVVSAVALIAVVGAAIGTVTTLALRSYLVDRLDDQLSVSLDMATRGPGAGKAARENSLGFVLAPGNPTGTAGIRLDSDGKVLGTGLSSPGDGSPSTTSAPSVRPRPRPSSPPPARPRTAAPGRWRWTCPDWAATGCAAPPTAAWSSPSRCGTSTVRWAPSSGSRSPSPSPG